MENSDNDDALKKLDELGYRMWNSSQSYESKDATKFLAPPSVTRTVRARRSRSADTSRSRATPAPRSAATRRLSRSVYRTPAPAYTKNLPPITPKVNPQTPLSILRQPRQGEMVVSMSGSPVMVPSCFAWQSEETANCNIMLTDGTTTEAAAVSQDYIVMHQLKTFKDNLSHIVRLGEKAIP